MKPRCELSKWLLMGVVALLMMALALPGCDQKEVTPGEESAGAGVPAEEGAAEAGVPAEERAAVPSPEQKQESRQKREQQYRAQRWSVLILSLK